MHVRHYDHGRLLALDCSIKRPIAECRLPINCHALDPRRLDEFAEVDHFRRRYDLLQSLSKRGQVFMAEHRGKIVAGLHIETGRTSLFKWNVPLPEDEACVRMMFTVPHLRGMNIMPSFLNFVSGELSRRGYQNLIMFVAADNASSERAARKVGYISTGIVGYLAVFEYHVYYSTIISLLLRTKRPIELVRLN